MPSADTPVRSRARSPQLVRLVLLGAVAGPLVALATTATSAPIAGPPVVMRPAMASAPVVLDLDVARRPARATRSVQARALWVRPVDGPIVSPFGPRWGGWHPGVDFQASYGTPIHVVGDGVVIAAGYLASEDGYGQIVLVQHAPGVVTAYAHASRIFVAAGQKVRAGDMIALAGATGYATGPHLHFEVRLDGQKVNPVPWLHAHGVSV